MTFNRPVGNDGTAMLHRHGAASPCGALHRCDPEPARSLLESGLQDNEELWDFHPR